MAARLTIAIIGPGNLGTALAVSLRRAGFAISAVIGPERSSSRARSLAKQVGAVATRDLEGLEADVVWFCVPDSEIARAARGFAVASWKGRVALHSSGVLTSDELNVLRGKGAAVASVHPLMTFVEGSRPALAGVPFAIEGDRRAARAARQIVRQLGGNVYSIRKEDKAAYHAWGTFASPLLTALLATTERIAGAAAVERAQARRRMIPILMQTLANYAQFGAAGGFSGPLVRGDVNTVRRHLRVLAKVPDARRVYRALAQAAIEYLPVKNKNELKRALETDSRSS